MTDLTEAGLGGTGLARTDRGGVAWLEISRPESRNALATIVLLSLREQLTLIGDDPDTKVVVFTGVGDVFCAGADLREFERDSAPRKSLARVRLVAEVLARMRGLEQPTIAAVNGAAIGAGWGLSLVCDVCFTVADATFCVPEIAKGFRLPAVLMHRLIQIVGPVRAAEIALGGATFDATQALAWGWATRSFADRAALVEQTWSFATELASRPRRSLASATGPLRFNSDPEPTPPSEYAWNEE